MMFISDFPNWNWFFTRTAAELDEANGNRHCPQWFREAFSWYRGRLSASRQTQILETETLQNGPPPRYCAFPVSTNDPNRKGFDAGAVALLDVDASGGRDSGITTEENECLIRSYESASFVFDIFRNFNPQIGYPRVEIQAQNVDGGSLALAAVMAALCQILNSHFPDTILATGCFINQKDERFETVGEDTFAQKIIASVRFGYKKLLLIEGQKGLWQGQSLTPSDLLETLKDENILPADAELEFVEIPKTPMDALIRILNEFPTPEIPEKVAFLLAAFGEKYLEYGNSERGQRLYEAIYPFKQSENNLVRHVALDILCRHELFRGNPEKAEEYRTQIPILRPSEFPVGRLGAYLKFQEVAIRCVLLLDSGIWDEDHRDFQQLDRTLERLLGNIDDHSADIEDFHNALALANTRAQRKMFFGRLHRAPEKIHEAWMDFTRIGESWTEIFDYTKEQGLELETFSRQRNYCLSCAADYWHLTGKRLESPYLRENFVFEDIKTAYDLTAWIQWNVVYDKKKNVHVSKVFDFLENLIKEKGITDLYYPYFCPYEKLLMYGIGSESELETARERVRRALPAFKKSGIDLLLGLRASWVISDSANMARFRELALHDALFKDKAEIILENPDEIAFRTPY